MHPGTKSFLYRKDLVQTFSDQCHKYNYTSNKKHFMKNVKECRDVIVKKVLKQGWDTRTTHYTHVVPMTLHRCHQLHDLYCLFV